MARDIKRPNVLGHTWFFAMFGHIICVFAEAPEFWSTLFSGIALGAATDRVVTYMWEKYG